MKIDNSVLATVIVSEFHEDKVDLIAAKLEELGIEITSKGDFLICIRTEKEIYEQIFGVSLQLRPYIPRAGTYGRRLNHNDWEQDRDEQIPKSLAKYIEGVYIETPAVMC